MGKSTSPGGAPGRRSSRHSAPAPGNGANTTGAAGSTPSSGGPRRTGRHGSTPVPDPPATSKDKVQSGAKTAPARSRGRSSSTPASGNKTPAAAAAATTGSKGGQKRSRLSRSAGLPKGSESGGLRKRGSVSFKDTSDAEDRSRQESSDEEHVPEIIDDTIYEPAEALIPEVTVLESIKPTPEAVPEPAAETATEQEEGKEIVDGPPAAAAAPSPPPQLILPTAAIGELAAAYAVLRSFSWQLRLSPFSFEDFCAAMSTPQPTALMDELHVCVLRALAFDEVEEEREERKLDLGMLDHLTWPCYVWEMLRLTEDPLAKYEWSQRLLEGIVPTTTITAPAAAIAVPEAPRQITPAAAVIKEEGAVTTTPPAAAAVDGADADGVNQGAGGNRGGEEVVANEAQPMEIDRAVPAATEEIGVPPPSGLVAAVKAAAAGGPSAPPPEAPASAPAVMVAFPYPQQSPRPRAFEPVNISQMDQQLAAAKATEAVESQELTAAQMFSGCAPAVHQQQFEYYSLPVETKAAILSRLCDHLLDCTTFRAEIDRREEENLFVGGPGDDEAGLFSMLPEKERERVAELIRAGKTIPDSNTEACVICGVGGSLMVCDGCPAAFHHRCIGERVSKQDKNNNNNNNEGENKKKKIQEEPWYCPECILGGRGETSGVRIPIAARNKWKQPLHIINGAVVCTQLPAVQSQGRHIKELSATAPVTIFTGPAAAEALATSRKVRDADELPFPSSFEIVQGPPPKLPVNKLPEGSAAAAAAAAAPPTTGPEGYNNKYRNAWTASSIALRATIEENKKKKVKGKLTIPTGTCGRLVVSKLPEPMPLSRYQWFQMQGRASARTTLRCGKCHTCLKPSLRKGCMNPILRAPEDLLNASPDTSKLSFLIAYVCKVEREFWALLEGPWATEPGGGMQFRAQWSGNVRNASNARDLAQSLVQLESLLRPVAFDQSWFGGGSDASASQPGSRIVSRSASMMDIQGSAGAGPSSQQTAATGDDGNDGPGSIKQRLTDPYDIRSEKVIKGAWEMDRRSHAAHLASVNRLPLNLLKKAARHGGRQPIPGVVYKKQEWKLLSPRLAWIAEIEAVQTCAQLALAIRKLDSVLNWEGIIKPKGLPSDAPFANASVHGKRPIIATDGTGSGSSASEYEYLIDMRYMSPADAAVLDKRQQHLNGLFKQQFAMSQAQVLMQAQQAYVPQEQQQQQQIAFQQRPVGPPVGPLAGLSAAFLGGASAGVVNAAAAPGRLGSLNTGFGAPVLQHQVPGGIPPLPPRPPLPTPSIDQDDQGIAGTRAEAEAEAEAAVPMDLDGVAAMMAAPQQQQQQLLAGMPGQFLPPGFPAFGVAPMGMVPAAPAMQISIAPAPVALAPAPVPAPEPAVEKQKLSEDEKLVHEIVETAIKKAVEAELLQMPAAMAAKLRRKQSLGGGGGGDSTADPNRTESDAAAAGAATTEERKPAVPTAALRATTSAPAMGVPPGVMPFFSAGVFARPPMLGPPPPAWTHERNIPLWFIRSYEERCRREAANVAARELQAAARGSQMDSAIKDAARKAAQVAAQAAADACGICSAAQGDTPELDALWICCDTCNRWFHGACVAMGQEDVNAIAEDEQWDCPGCANARRKAERAARREGKTLPSTFTPMDADAAAKNRKPFYEYADYKAGEAKMLEKLKRGEPLSGSGSRGKKGSVGGASGASGSAQAASLVAENAEESAARQAARMEYKKRKREEQARLAAEPIHCPVCQYPDFGRALVECDACHRWFHYECVGTAIEEVETSIKDEKPLRCAECQGKRVRPPTQAAIDAAILAAADMKGPRKKMREDSVQPALPSDVGAVRGGGGFLGGSTAAATMQRGVAPPAPATVLQSPSGRNFNWRDAVNKIIVKLMRLSVAGPFCRPVSLEDAPDYLEIVKQPMDLDTLHSAIPRLRSPLDVLAGVNLIVDNCILYNGEGSDFAAAAVDMQRSFLKLWGAKGMPLTTEQWDSMLAGESRRPPREPTATTGGAVGGGDGGSIVKRTGSGITGGVASARKKAGFVASLTALSPAPGASPAYNWQLRASKALKHLAKLPAAEPFLEPVPDDFLDYHEVIEKPMDIGTIQEKLSQGAYNDPSKIAADVAQVWTNCRAFNKANADIVADATSCEKAFIQYWIAEGVYQGGKTAKVADSSGRSVAPYIADKIAPAAPGSGRAFRSTAPAPAVRPAPMRTLGGAPAKEGGGPDSLSKSLDPSPFSQPAVPDWHETARKVLYRMINFVTEATWFVDPVSAEDAPDYHQIVQNPMNLSTVLEKVKSGEYATPAEVEADVELIWKNAALYNGLEHPVAKAAAKARESFNKIWVSSGLDPEGLQQKQQQLQQQQRRQHHHRQQQQLARQQPAGAGGGTASGFDASSQHQQDWVSTVRRVLSGITNLPSCAPFNGQISDSSKPGYSQIIEHHMDFGQILRNLGRGRYANPSEVMQDIRLLLLNWKRYGEMTGGRDQTYQRAGLDVGRRLMKDWNEYGLPM